MLITVNKLTSYPQAVPAKCGKNKDLSTGIFVLF